MSWIRLAAQGLHAGCRAPGQQSHAAFVDDFCGPPVDSVDEQNMAEFAEVWAKSLLNIYHIDRIRKRYYNSDGLVSEGAFAEKTSRDDVRT